MSVGEDARDKAHVVPVLMRINPVNESDSSPFWRNDTLLLYRTCPEAASIQSAIKVTVIGRNFDAAGGRRMWCRWSTNAHQPVDTVGRADSGRLYPPFIVEATVLSGSRVECTSPTFEPTRGLNDWRATLTLALHGGVWSDTSTSSRGAVSFNLTRTPSRTVYGGCLIPRTGQEDSMPGAEEDRWFELRSLNTAWLSFDFSHLPTTLVYGDHFRVALHAAPSTCLDAQCDGTGNPVSVLSSPCTQPLRMPAWFNDGEVDKRLRWNLR